VPGNGARVRALVIFFCESTPHSCDADSNATVLGELQDVYY